MLLIISVDSNDETVKLGLAGTLMCKARCG